jgi:hypothetical protein
MTFPWCLALQNGGHLFPLAQHEERVPEGRVRGAIRLVHKGGYDGRSPRKS